MTNVKIMCDEYNLLMPFIDSSDSFTLGFECGLIWSHLLNRTQYEFTVHKSNIEQMKEIAKHFKFNLTIEDPFDDINDENYETINNEWVLIGFNPIVKNLKLVK